MPAGAATALQVHTACSSIAWKARGCAKSHLSSEEGLAPPLRRRLTVVRLCTWLRRRLQERQHQVLRVRLRPVLAAARWAWPTAAQERRTSLQLATRPLKQLVAPQMQPALAAPVRQLQRLARSRARVRQVQPGNHTLHLCPAPRRSDRWTSGPAQGHYRPLDRAARPYIFCAGAGQRWRCHWRA